MAHIAPQLNYNLAKHTSWRVGGNAKKYYAPKDLLEFLSVIDDHAAAETTILGLGSNLLVRDGGIDGIVVDTKQALNAMVRSDKHMVYVQAGVPCAKFARFCAKEGLADAEFFAGIPGTMGGALRMNAGCYGSETWEFVNMVDIVHTKGGIRSYAASEFTFGYRHLDLPEGSLILGAWFRFPQGDAPTAIAKIKKLLEQRALTQPTGSRNSGSVFKNPKDDFAGRLIETAGLKGYQLGGAKVSEKHANFIINDDAATAADIEQLIYYIQSVVQDKHGIFLEPEVHIIGNAHA